MTTDTTAAPRVATASRTHRDGWICLAGGLVGVAQAAFMIFAPASVGEDRYSYPFAPTGYVVAQSGFFLQHLLLAVGLWAVFRLPALHASRVGRFAAAAATVGMVLLALLELVAIGAADEPTSSDKAQLITNSYAAPVLLLGLALIAAGAAASRTPGESWAGARWLPGILIVLGAYVFVPLTPALTGSFLAGRLGIGGWMMLFAFLGYGLTRVNPRAAHGSRS